MREVESREFVDVKSNSHELQLIGSGAEPQAERLITLTPVALTAHQVVSNDAKEPTPTSAVALKKTAEDEGFDVNVMVIFLLYLKSLLIWNTLIFQ